MIITLKTKKKPIYQKSCCPHNSKAKLPLLSRRLALYPNKTTHAGRQQDCLNQSKQQSHPTLDQRHQQLTETQTSQPHPVATTVKPTGMTDIRGGRIPLACSQRNEQYTYAIQLNSQNLDKLIIIFKEWSNLDMLSTMKKFMFFLKVLEIFCLYFLAAVWVEVPYGCSSGNDEKQMETAQHSQLCLVHFPSGEAKSERNQPVGWELFFSIFSWHQCSQAVMPYYLRAKCSENCFSLLSSV